MTKPLPRQSRTVLALMDDESYVPATVERESQNPDQKGWLLLSYHDLLWWAEPSEYKEAP